MRRPGYKYMLAALDLGILNFSFLMSELAAGNSLHTNMGSSYFSISPELALFGCYSLAIIVIFQHENLYKINVFLSGADQIVKVATALFYSVLGLALVSFFTKSPFITESRLTITFFFAFAFLLSSVSRVFIFRNVFRLFSKISLYRRKVLIIGAGQTGKMLAANLRLNSSYGIRIVGFLDDEVARDTNVFMGIKVIGKVDDVHFLVKKHRIAEVIVAVDNIGHDRLLQIIDLFKNRTPHVKIASSLYDIIPARLFTERYGDVPLTNMLSHNGTLTQYYVKRLFDFFLTLVGLVFLVPLFLVIAVLIKLNSRGPILYRQTRIGKNGKPFEFYKFRSMYVNSDKDDTRKAKVARFIKQKMADGSSTKIVDEQNVTKVGRFIRRTSLDELPQLFNVLKGEMSLVGPRPCLPYEWEHYENWHKRRLSVIPGCTGLWQVNGRSEVGFDDMVILDLYYIGNRSFLLDLQIILKTIPVMLLARGAK